MHAAPEESLEPAGAVTKNNRRSIANAKQRAAALKSAVTVITPVRGRERERAERRERERERQRSLAA